MKIPKKFGAVIAAILMVTMLAAFMNIQPASGLCALVEVPESSSQSTTFSRVWCEWYDGVLGVPDATLKYPDVAHVDTTMQIYIAWGGHLHAELWRDIKVYDENGYLCGTGVYGKWLQTWDSDYYFDEGYHQIYVEFYDDLAIDYDSTSYGLRYYWSGSPTDFAGYKWVVSYSIILYSHGFWDDLIDLQVHDFGDIKHDEIPPNQGNYELCPEDTSTYGSTVQWYEVYGQGSVITPNYLLGSAPNGYNAQISATSLNSVARICAYTNAPTYGEIYIYGRSVSNQARFLVYTSTNNYNWVLGEDQTVQYSANNQWIYCGHTVPGARYVLVVVYDSGIVSTMNIDCVSIGHDPS